MVVLNPGGGAFFGHSRAEVTRWIAAGGVSGYLVEKLDLVWWTVGRGATRLHSKKGRRNRRP
jgi:hypothetical protein